VFIDRDFSIRSVALRLVYRLLPTLNVEHLFEISQILSIDGPTACQHWTLEIYKWMYEFLTSSSTSTNLLPVNFYDHVREQLLQFLSNKTESIRVNCRNFWCDTKRTSLSSQHRLIALVDQLYSRRTEDTYLHYSTNFLLERISHSPDYHRPLFEHPLDQCLFQEFPLTCDWRQRHHTYTTPLFTLQSQVNTSNATIETHTIARDPVQFMQTLIESTSSKISSHVILSTQEHVKRQEFLPTQTSDTLSTMNYNWLKQSETFDTITSSSTSMNKTSLIINVDKINKQMNSNDDDIFRLKRRFLKDNGQLHKYFVRQQYEKNEKEKELLNDTKRKQDNQVEKYRQYRIGELPDIQIRCSDIIIPLQALAQYDNHMARLLYTNLFTSILTSLEAKLSSDEYTALLVTIQHRFNLMLSQSERVFRSFVASILDIVLVKSSHMKIDAHHISSASLASQLESMGILTLECFIRLLNNEQHVEHRDEPIKKKFKGEKKHIDYCLELAKCARSMNVYDDVRGILSQLSDLKPITLKAIEEESQSDFLSALNSYVTALETNPLVTDDNLSNLEHEFWSQSMLNCCDQLSNWQLMSKHIFFDGSITFDSLWSDVQQLNSVLPYAIRSKLKLLVTGNEQEQLEQEDLGQFFNSLSTINNTSNIDSMLMVKRAYIEQHYPFQLAIFFFYQKDFDRS
jgi:DNA-dependent protein kinase catalytic subunit